MKPFLLISAVIFLAALAPINAMATLFINNITIADNNGAGDGWYGAQEDQEVEPGMATGQSWDLEGFFLNGTTLTMVGGFDFINGNSGYNSGDIFIDTNGDAQYGDIHGKTDGNISVNNDFGYDYVLDIDFSSWTYDVYFINHTENQDIHLITAHYSQNQGSSPWRYDNGGTKIGSDISFSSHMEGLADTEVDFLGGIHNVVSVNLDFLPHNQDLIFHFTMGCGNDNLMGKGAIPNPEPATLILMGFGLIGLAGIGRKKMIKR